MSEWKVAVVAVCRKVKGQQLASGAVVGFTCTRCGEPLQASPPIAARIRAKEVLPLCNACGMQISDQLAERGATIVPVMMPGTKRAFQEGRIPDATRAFVQRLGFCPRCAEEIPNDEPHVCNQDNLDSHRDTSE